MSLPWSPPRNTVTSQPLSNKLTHTHRHRHTVHTHKVDDLEKANNELEALAKLYDDQKLEMKDEIVKLRKENKKLVAEHPVTYMKVKRAFTGCGSRVCTIM